MNVKEGKYFQNNLLKLCVREALENFSMHDIKSTLNIDGLV